MYAPSWATWISVDTKPGKKISNTEKTRSVDLDLDGHVEGWNQHERRSLTSVGRRGLKKTKIHILRRVSFTAFGVLTHKEGIQFDI